MCRNLARSNGTAAAAFIPHRHRMTVPDTYDPLARVSAYQLAVGALRDARRDAATLAEVPGQHEIAAQLLRAVGSVAANIAEGYSRASLADRRRFLEYALGSTRESLVWYEAIATADTDPRIERLVSIRRLLLTMIRNSRRPPSSATESKAEL